MPTGAVADYLGRKYSLALGALFIAFAALVYGSIPRFEIFLIGEFLFAMGRALFSGADEALLYDCLKEAGREGESKKVFGKANAVHLLGLLVAAPVGSFIASRFGLNRPMQFSAIPFFMASIIALTIREPFVEKTESESKRYFDIVKKGFYFFYRQRTLRLLALDGIVVSSAAYFVIWLYQPLLQSVGVSIFYFGFIHALLLIAEIFVSSNFERLDRLFGSGKLLLRFSALITAFSFLLVAAFPNIIAILFFIILGGGFGLTRLTLMSTYMNKFIPSRERATVLSSISMFLRFTLVVLNPIIGFTADHSLASALFLVGLLPLSIFLFSPVKQEMLEAV